MKKFLKITGGIILGLILMMMVLPMLFKGKIESLVKEQINANVNARVDYSGFSLSLIKNFPNIHMGIDGLSVVGNAPFESDTLLYLDQFSAKVGMLGALAGEVEVKSVLLSGVYVNAMVLADSTANWHISKASEEVVMEEEEGEASAFKVVLQSFVINNANIRYVDQTTNMQSEIKDFNLALSGDMSAQQTNLDIQSDIAQLMFDYDGVKYVNGASLGLQAGIGADLENMVFSFLDNELKVNGLVLKLDGSVAVKEEGYGLDLKMGTTKTDFKSLLALVPEEFLKDFEGLQTQGTMHVDVVVKGDYIDEEHLPAFTLDLGVENGMIQYPALPESIDNITIALLVNNSGGSADLTETELKKFHFEIAQNPFDASFKVLTPVSNPSFSSQVKGKIDLHSLSNAIPLDSFEIKGLIETDFAIAGDYAMIESEAYEQIDAKGQLALADFSYQGANWPLGVLIRQSVMSVNPRSIKLESFHCQIGKSDFSLKGSLENYLAYALKDGTLKGSLTHSSKLINTNELLKLVNSEDESVSEAGETEVVEVPKNLDFVFQSQVEQLVYDKLDIYRANGKITVRNGVVKLDGLKMRLLDGSLAMTGEYNTADMQKPFVDFAFEGADLDLNMAANSFSVVDSLLPLAKNTVGKVSPKFKYNSILSQDAKPVMATVNGGGWLRSQKVEVSGSKIQNSLASTLNNESYRTMRAEDLNINFVLDKGNVIVKPFKTKVGGKIVEVQGVQGLDQSIDYKITMPVSRKEVAKMAGSLGFSLPTSGDDLIVDVLVKGTVQEPQLSFGLDKAKKQIEKDLKKEGENLLKNLLKGF